MVIYLYHLPWNKFYFYFNLMVHHLHHHHVIRVQVMPYCLALISRATLPDLVRFCPDSSTSSWDCLALISRATLPNLVRIFEDPSTSWFSCGLIPFIFEGGVSSTIASSRSTSLYFNLALLSTLLGVTRNLAMSISSPSSPLVASNTYDLIDFGRRELFCKKPHSERTRECIRCCAPPVFKKTDDGRDWVLQLVWVYTE